MFLYPITVIITHPMEQRFRVVAVNPNLWNPRSPDDHSQGLEYAMPTLRTSQQMRSDRCGWLM